MSTTFGNYDPGDLIQDTHVEAFNAPVNNLENGATYYGEAGNPTGTSTDDYSVTVNAGATPAYSVTLAAGLIVHLKLPAVANTKPATLSVNATAAKPIKKIGQSLQAGDLPADAIAVLIYDADLDVFQLIAVANHTHAAGDIASGTLQVARGGLGADHSASGPGVAFQSALGANFSVSDVIPFLLKLIAASGVATPICLDAKGNHATNPVAVLRQDNGGGTAQLLDLYHDHVAGANGAAFIRFYRDAGGTPVQVAQIDTRGAFVTRPQATSGLVTFAVVSNAAAAISAIYPMVDVYLFDDAANSQIWARLAVEQRVITDGSEAGKLYLQLMAGGTLRSVYVVDEDTDLQQWLLNNGTRMALSSSFLRTSGGFKSGANADPLTIIAGVGMFASVQPHAELLTGTGNGTYEELVVIRHSGHDSSAVLRRLGLILKLSAEGNTTQSDRSGGMILESSAANAGTPSLFLVQGNAKRVEIDSSGNVDILGGAGKLKIGGTAVTADAGELNILDGATLSTSELNLLDITGRATGDALLATGATSAAWRTRVQQKADTRVGFAARLTTVREIASSTFVKVGQVDDDCTVIFDSDGMFTFDDDGAGPPYAGDFVIPTGMTGAWRVSCHITFEPHATGSRSARLYSETDAGPLVYDARLSISGSAHTTVGFSQIVYLVAGQRYSFQGWQNSGIGIDMVDELCHISAEFLGA